MPEMVEEKIKRRGEMKHENTKRRNRRIADGELFIKYNDKWHNTILGGFIEDFEDYEFERIHQERKDDNQTILL